MDLSTSNIITIVMGVVGIYVLVTKQIAVIETEIKELTKTVDKHNQIVERTYKLERDMSTAFMRIDENREGIKENRDKIEMVQTKVGGTD